jgi:hypothetical protein
LDRAQIFGDARDAPVQVVHVVVSHGVFVTFQHLIGSAERVDVPRALRFGNSLITLV